MRTSWVRTQSGVGFKASEVSDGLPVLSDKKAKRASALTPDNGFSSDLIQALPAAIYTTDEEGRITFYNEAAAELWGCRPEIGKNEFCGSWKLYRTDGTRLPHDECPMALALKEKRPIRGVEAVAERPDGTRVPFIPYPTPLFDGSGALIGAINMLVDISDRKRTEHSLTKRRDEQTALYQFTNRLYRAVTLQDVYEAALDAIQQALGCQRASILIFDTAGVMRFAAWHGLSDAYRNAVEGHSPWTRDAKDPEPLCVADIDEADIASDLKSTVKAEGIQALAFIPILAKGELIGKFMTYYDAPHAFSEDEVELAATIARQLGFSIDRLRTEEARQRAEEASRLLAAIVETSGDAIASKNLDGIVTSWNGGAERLFGYAAAEIIGKSITTVIPPERLDEETRILEQVRRGEPVVNFETVRRRKDGSLVDISLAVSPVKDDRGIVVGASKIARDITERKQAEARQELLTQEIHHRTRNMYAVISSVVSSSFAGQSTVEEAEAAVRGRLHSLAQTNSLLMEKIEGAQLAESSARR